MGTQQSTMDYLVEQTESAGSITTKRMFGEFALYCDTKVVGFVCDDQLFIKPTEAGRAWIGTVTEGHPYPGSKPYFLIDGERWDDAEWLSGLVKVSADELPLPKPKKAKAKK